MASAWKTTKTLVTSIYQCDDRSLVWNVQKYNLKVPRLLKIKISIGHCQRKATTVGINPMTFNLLTKQTLFIKNNIHHAIYFF